jgi:TRAP-type C4-dicarboxylate transport system permease small subunit
MVGNQTDSLLAKLVRMIDSISNGILYICLIGMVILTVIDTLLRSFTNIGIGGVAEACTYLLVLVGFLGLARTQAVKGHIEVNFLSDRFPMSMKYYVKQIITIILILFCFLFIYAGTLKAISAFTSRESNWFGIRILPVWFFRFAVPVGFCFLIFELLKDILETNASYKKQRGMRGRR